MAKVEIAHNPELSQEQLFELFKNKFKGKYEVYFTKMTNRFFIVKQTNVSGAAVSLVQKKNKTIISYFRFAPSTFARFFVKSFVLMFFGGQVMKDIQSYLQANKDNIQPISS
jgi:hypothetical protein